MKNYIINKDKSVMKHMIHRLILWLLKISKSKYKLIDPFLPMTIDYQKKEILYLKTEMKIPYDFYRIENFGYDKQKTFDIAKNILTKKLTHQIFEAKVATFYQTEDRIVAEIKVLKP